MEPQFLTLDEVLEVHLDQIERYGGTLRVRDHALLESAVAAPQSGFGGHYLHGDLFEMASAYLFHLVQNHLFLDGNKRVGTATALTFLELNGLETKIPNQALVATVLAVAQGETEKSAIAAFFRKHAKSWLSPASSFFPPSASPSARLGLYQKRHLLHPRQPRCQRRRECARAESFWLLRRHGITFVLLRRFWEQVWIGVWLACLAVVGRRLSSLQEDTAS
jgi:death-on-curing protein